MAGWVGPVGGGGSNVPASLYSSDLLGPAPSLRRAWESSDSSNTMDSALEEASAHGGMPDNGLDEFSDNLLDLASSIVQRSWGEA